MKNTFDLFIFDFDGTLANSKKSITNSLNYALSQKHLPVVASEQVHPLIGKLSIEKTFPHFYPTLKQQEIVELVDIFRVYQREHLKTDLEFFPHVIDTLYALKRKSKYMAILTTRNIKQMLYTIQVYQLESLFPVVYGDGLIAAHKPDKACVEYIWSNLPTTITKGRTVMVGDSSVDVETAKNADISMIGVSYGVDGEEGLKKLGVNHVLHDFSEILAFSE